MVLMLAIPVATAAQDKDKKDKGEKKVYTGTPVMWRDPADISSRNLILGAGGEEMKPDISKITKRVAIRRNIECAMLKAMNGSRRLARKPSLTRQQIVCCGRWVMKLKSPTSFPI